jgi:hypothetical protein
MNSITNAKFSAPRRKMLTNLGRWFEFEEGVFHSMSSRRQVTIAVVLFILIAPIVVYHWTLLSAKKSIEMTLTYCPPPDADLSQLSTPALLTCRDVARDRDSSVVRFTSVCKALAIGSLAQCEKRLIEKVMDNSAASPRGQHDDPAYDDLSYCEIYKCR